MKRTIPGIGTAEYDIREERLVRQILASDSETKFNEVHVLHELKVFLDATPVWNEWGPLADPVYIQQELSEMSEREHRS